MIFTTLALVASLATQAAPPLTPTLVCTHDNGCSRWPAIPCGSDSDCQRLNGGNGENGFDDRPLRVIGYGCGPDRVTAIAPEEDELPGPRCDAVEAWER